MEEITCPSCNKILRGAYAKTSLYRHIRTIHNDADKKVTLSKRKTVKADTPDFKYVSMCNFTDEQIEKMKQLGKLRRMILYTIKLMIQQAGNVYHLTDKKVDGVKAVINGEWKNINTINAVGYLYNLGYRKTMYILSEQQDLPHNIVNEMNDMRLFTRRMECNKRNIKSAGNTYCFKKYDDLHYYAPILNLLKENKQIVLNN